LEAAASLFIFFFSMTDFPPEVISRLHKFDEDGHIIKLGRAALVVQQLLKKYENADWINLKGDAIWNKIDHMIVDSVGDGGDTNGNWVRGAGDERAWEVSKPFKFTYTVAAGR
jgi:hypothetical protein